MRMIQTEMREKIAVLSDSDVNHQENQSKHTCLVPEFDGWRGEVVGNSVVS